MINYVSDEFEIDEDNEKNIRLSSPGKSGGLFADFLHRLAGCDTKRLTILYPARAHRWFDRD